MFLPGFSYDFIIYVTFRFRLNFLLSFLLFFLVYVYMTFTL